MSARRLPGMGERGVKRANTGPARGPRGDNSLPNAHEVASAGLGGSKSNPQSRGGSVGPRTYPGEKGGGKRYNADSRPFEKQPITGKGITKSFAEDRPLSNKGAHFGGMKIDEGPFEPTGPGAGGGPAKLPSTGFTFGAGMGSHLEGPDEDVGGDGDQAHYGPYLNREGRMNHPAWHGKTIK